MLVFIRQLTFLYKNQKVSQKKKTKPIYYPELNIPFPKLCSGKTLSLVHKCVVGRQVLGSSMPSKMLTPLYKASSLYE